MPGKARNRAIVAASARKNGKMPRNTSLRGISGRTAETASQLLIIRELLTEKLGPDGFKNQVVATTDANAGTLRTIATEANLRTLVVPDGVGGRFTVLSAVGLFSAAMCGVDIDSLLAGA